jgi:hypothetical protein
LLLSDGGEEWDYGQPVQSVGETRKFVVSRLDPQFVFLIPFPSEALAVESRVDIRSVSLRIHEKLSLLSVTGHPDWNYPDGEFYDSDGHAISRDAALSSYRGKDPMEFCFRYTFLSVRWPGLQHEVVDPKTPLKTICEDLTAISPCRIQFDGREIEGLATPIGSLDATKDIQIRRVPKIIVQFPERRTRQRFEEDATIAEFRESAYGYLARKRLEILDDIEIEMGDRVLTGDQFLYRELVGTELSVIALPTRQCQVYRPDHKKGKVVHVRVTDTVGEVIAGLRPDGDPHTFVCTIRGTDSPLVLEERLVSLGPRGTPVQTKKLRLQYTIKYGSRELIGCLPDEARFHGLRLLAHTKLFAGLRVATKIS